MVNKWFYGSCIISIRDLLLTNYFNVINLEAGEILVKEINPRKSYFKEYETLRRECVVRIIHVFSGKTKGISICTDEIINYDSKRSYYDEFEGE